MNSETPAFFESAERFEQVALPVTGYVMINIVAHNCVKCFIGKVEFNGVALPEFHIRYSFRFCVILAKRFII